MHAADAVAAFRPDNHRIDGSIHLKSADPISLNEEERRFAVPGADLPSVISKLKFQRSFFRNHTEQTSATLFPFIGEPDAPTGIFYQTPCPIAVWNFRQLLTVQSKDVNSGHCIQIEQSCMNRELSSNIILRILEGERALLRTFGGELFQLSVPSVLLSDVSQAPDAV